MLRALRLSAVAALGIAVLAPATASATYFSGPDTVTHTKPSGCPDLKLCVYSEDNFGGTRTFRADLIDRDWRNNNYQNGSTTNDNSNSIFNSSYRYSKRVFRDVGYGDHVLCLAPDTGIRDLDQVKWSEVWAWWVEKDDLQDKISSHKSHATDIDDLDCDWRAG